MFIGISGICVAIGGTGYACGSSRSCGNDFAPSYETFILSSFSAQLFFGVVKQVEQ